MWEWVWCGWYRVYTSSPQVDPVHNVGPGAGRAVRGGYWNNYPQYCRSAYRSSYVPDSDGSSVGFRPVRSVF